MDTKDLINGILIRRGQRLRACSTCSPQYGELGNWYITDSGWRVVASHVDISALAEELGLEPASAIKTVRF